MQGSKTIRALQRGLEVIDALRTRPISSLHDIHLATRIPKPTLLRILHTLDRAGLVSRRLADGHYRLSTFTGVRRKHDRHDRVAEAAAPVLVRLCQKVKWPSDLCVPAGDHMEGRETSRPYSPFVVRPVAYVVGARINWLMTGVGRVYLAWCPEKEREEILRKLRKSENPSNRLARDPGFVGGHYGGPPIDDGLAGIAVALRDGVRVHGSINILWIRAAFTVEDFAARHLTDLQDAAHEIVSSLQRPTSSRLNVEPGLGRVR